MNFILIISLVCLFVGFLLLGYLSPYNGDISEVSFDIIDEQPQVTNVVEVEKIVEVPVEVIKTEIEVFEDLDRINELEQKIRELESIKKTVWRNIGLELFQETDLDRFVEKLNFMIGKKLLIVTDSSYVLGANFKDHKVYEGTLNNYEILEGRYPEQPSIKLIINVPVLSTTTVSLNWVFDKYRFDDNFSSSELVSNFLKTRIPINELLLIEV
jgi:hypothetical protein